MKSWLAGSMLVGALFAVACDDDHGHNEPSDPSCPTYAEGAKPFVDKYCVDCHSESKTTDSARMGAPLSVNFGTEAQLREHGAHAAERVSGEAGEALTMPPPTYAKEPSDDERIEFLDWLDCSGAINEGHGDHSH